MSSHGKKMLAPVIITFVFLLYLLIYVVMLAQVVMAEPLALILAIPLVLLGVGMVYVLFARIREIRSGEVQKLKFPHRGNGIWFHCLFNESKIIPGSHPAWRTPFIYPGSIRMLSFSLSRKGIIPTNRFIAMLPECAEII